MLANVSEDARGTSEGNAMLRRFLEITRISGCCFLQGLFSDTSQVKPKRISWYLLYTSACLCLIWYTVLYGASYYGAIGTLNDDIYALVCIVYFLQCNATLKSMMVYAPQLVQVLEMSALFESKWPLTPGMRRRMKLLSLVLPIYVVFDFLQQNFIRFYRVATAFDIHSFIAGFVNLLGVLSVLSWANVSGIGTFLVARLLSVYVRAVHHYLQINGK